MKRVLFITYYWPPSGKASLHWPLKIIKRLPQFGIEPFVLTSEEDVFGYKDESLLAEVDPKMKVLRAPSWEPFPLYKKFLGKEKEIPLVPSEAITKIESGFKHKLSIWIRMNLFVPDARVGWYFSSWKKLKKFISSEKIEAVVSVGPPHTAHLIGKKAACRFDIPFIPVFIDPWVDIVYYKDFRRNKLTLKIDNHLESKVIGKATKIIFVTETMKNAYAVKYDEIESKSHVLYWGYDEEDFSYSFASGSDREKVILHAGNIFDYQNPVSFWKEIKRRILAGDKIKIKFAGTVSPAVKRSISENGLSDATEYLGFISYKSMIEEIMRADYLLVCASEPRHVPGKLFEYMRSGKPIIAFGNENAEVKKILTGTNSGMLFRYEESAGEFFELADKFKTDLTKVKEFDRKKTAEKLSRLLKD